MGSYTEIVVKSAHGYIDQLAGIKGRDKDAAQKVAELYAYVLERRSHEKLGVKLDKAVSALEQVQRPEDFVNRYSLGFGNPDARIVFLGQEWAFDLDEEHNLGFVRDCCLLTFLWLLDAQGDLDLAVNMGSWLLRRFKKRSALVGPFHRYPNYYRKSKPGHAWNVMGRLVKSLFYPSDKEKLRILTPGFKCSDDCYVIDMNLLPSKKHRNSKRMTDAERLERMNFMRQVLKSLSNAEFIIVHGFVSTFRKDKPEFLSKLGFDPKINVEKFRMPRGKTSWRQYAAKDGNRVVFLTQQLSGSTRFTAGIFEKWAKWLAQI